jgi:hypothetical protein
VGKTIIFIALKEKFNIRASFCPRFAPISTKHKVLGGTNNENTTFFDDNFGNFDFDLCGASANFRL